MPAFLYWTLSSDDFFAHMTKTSKGTNMPRGDKNAIMQYEISLPSLSAQEAVCSVLNPLRKKMISNAKLNGYLAESTISSRATRHRTHSNAERKKMSMLSVSCS